MTHVIRPWTEEEDAQLLALIDAGNSYQAAADQLDRPRSGVATRLKVLRHGHSGPTRTYRATDARCSWTPDQDSLLLLHYGSMSNEELARLVGKTERSLRVRASRLRQGHTRATVIPMPNMRHDTLAGDRTRQQKATIQQLLTRDHYPETGEWETFDDFCVRLFYGERPLPELAALLGRTAIAVKGRVATLNWSLDKAIAFRLEVSRSPLWVEALQCLQAAPGQQRAAVAEAKRTQTRRVINDLIKINNGSAHERLAKLTGYIAKLQCDLENAE